jgi:hypothetical protein
MKTVFTTKGTKGEEEKKEKRKEKREKSIEVTGLRSAAVGRFQRS